MKCLNCGFENVEGAEFCGNCGMKQQSMHQVQTLKKNKKKIIIISVLLVLILFIIILFLIFHQPKKFKDPFQDVDDLVIETDIKSTREYEAIDSVSETLEKEFNDNKITADQYIMELAYSIYDSDKLNDKYQDLEIGTPNPVELFQKAAELVDNLSVESAKYIADQYFLSEVKWNVETDSNASGMKRSNDYKVMPLVSDETDVSKLDKVILSSSNHFLVYYTTNGSNAITNDNAKKIAQELETAVASYEKKYGLKFQYDPSSDDSTFRKFVDATSFEGLQKATSKAEKVLKNSNIDSKYLDTAMPVYIIDTDSENTNVIGYYVPAVISDFERVILKGYDIFDNLGVQLDSILTTYAFPYFVVSSSLDNFDNTKITLTHELFHHYQQYICGNGIYGECKSGSFTKETTANFAAADNVNIQKFGTVLNNHAVWYIRNLSSSIDKVGLKDYGDLTIGYGAFVFARNYSEVVENGYHHLFQSMKYEDPLKYIYDNSGGNYQKAMLLTAERNLTLDYDNKLYIAQTKEELYYPANYKELGTLNNKVHLTIDYSSMQYFYINPSEFKSKTAQIVFNGSNDDLSLLLFVKENDKYKALYTHSLSTEFVINVSDFTFYDEVVFGIVNSSIVNHINYNIEIDENGIKTPTVTAKSLKLNTLEDVLKNQSSFMCHQVEEDEDWYNVYQIKVGFDKDLKLNEMYFKGTYKIKNYTEENGIAFGITQKIVSGLLYAMEKAYKEQFKYVDTIINESDDEYSVTFKITKNYYDALNERFHISGNTKLEIIQSIQSEGFVCKFE